MLLETVKKDYEGAEEAYRTALKYDSKYSMGWEKLGAFLYNKRKNYTGAEEAYQTAIKIYQ